MNTQRTASLRSISFRNFRRSDSLPTDTQQSKLASLLRSRLLKAKPRRRLDGRSAFYRWHLHTRLEIIQQARKSLVISSKITVAKSLFILLLHQQEHTSEECPSQRRIARAVRNMHKLLGGEAGKRLFLQLMKERANYFLLRIIGRQYTKKLSYSFHKLQLAKEGKRFQLGGRILHRIMSKMNNYRCSALYEIKRNAQLTHLRRLHAISRLAQALSHIARRSQLYSLAKLRVHSAARSASVRLLHLLHDLVRSRSRVAFRAILRNSTRHNGLVSLVHSLSHITGRRRREVLLSVFNALSRTANSQGVAQSRALQRKGCIRKEICGLLVKQKMKLLFALRMLRFNHGLQAMLRTHRRHELATRLTVLIQKEKRKQITFFVRHLEKQAYQGRYKELALRRTLALIARRCVQQSYSALTRNMKRWNLMDKTLRMTVIRAREALRTQFNRLKSWNGKVRAVEQGTRGLITIIERRSNMDQQFAWEGLKHRALAQLDKSRLLLQCLYRRVDQRKSVAWRSIQLYAYERRGRQIITSLGRLHAIFQLRLFQGLAMVAGASDFRDSHRDRMGRGFSLTSALLGKCLRRAFEGIRLEGRYRDYREEYLRHWRGQAERQEARIARTVHNALSKREKACQVLKACDILEALAAKAKVFGFQRLREKSEYSRRQATNSVLIRKLVNILHGLVLSRRLTALSLVLSTARERRALRLKVTEHLRVEMKGEYEVRRPAHQHAGLVLKRYVYFTRFCKVVSHMLLERKKAFFARLLSSYARSQSPEQYSGRKDCDTSRTRISARSLFTTASARTVEDRIMGLAKLKNIVFDLGRVDYGAPTYVHGT